MRSIRDRWRRFEEGFATSVQGVFYVVLLWWCFGLVFDLGGAAYRSARLRSAAVSAAQDAAKYVDVAEIYRSDRLQIDAGAARARAQTVFHRAMAGIPAEIAVSVQSGVLRDFVVVDARTIAPMYILRGFGMRDLTLTVHFAAEAVPGIEDEYQ